MARRGSSRLLLEAAAVLCVVLAGAWWIFSRSVYSGATELRAAVNVPSPTRAEEAIVEAVTGSVQRNNAHGPWVEVIAGEHLRTDDGAVTLTTNDKSIEVAAGKQVVAMEGQAPAAAEPIPASVLLKVANAAASTDGVCATIDGVAPPGTEISVDGVAAEVAPDGR